MSITLRRPPLNLLQEVQENLLQGFQWCLRITGKLCFARATQRGRAEGPEGRDPSRPYPLGFGVSVGARFIAPLYAPQEWGKQGIEDTCQFGK